MRAFMDKRLSHDLSLLSDAVVFFDRGLYSSRISKFSRWRAAYRQRLNRRHPTMKNLLERWGEEVGERLRLERRLLFTAFEERFSPMYKVVPHVLGIYASF